MVRQSARQASKTGAATAAAATATATATTATSVSITRIKKTVSAKSNGTGVKKETADVETKVEVKKTNVAKRKAPAPATIKDEDDSEDDSPVKKETAKKPAAKKRKTKVATKGDDNMILAPRTAVTSLKRAMYIGAHVSGAGGVQNSIQNAVNIGANSFALFLKSQRKWSSPPLAADAKTQFHAMLKQHGYDAAQHILPHGSYLVNLAQADKTKADQAYENFIDDLQRCEALGIRLYNFHPGSTGGETMAAATGRIAAQLNRAHKATKSVITVIENMCGSGNVVGSRFEDLRDIIRLVDDKSRVGVCIDTCHAFAAGYDLRSPEAFAETVAKFDEIVGLKYLKAFHLNDSKAPFASHRDLHANIGTGFLGLRAFHSIVNHEAFQDLPMVLETPIDEKGPDGKSVENKQIWADEIKLLESLIGADAGSAEFKAQAVELQAKGAAERAKVQDQVDKKAVKDAKKGTKKAKAAAPKKGGRAKKKDEDEDDEEEEHECGSGSD
ncbi:xylose isomerase-like protein [Bombardia bombarda]|uniref:Apurinic-apyrimidinic endonuclease 1 n=1 Tax=Bombardia bombarda TaxID=252184 RepID=A0AA40BYB2_9PEZI|nr:xylose isomerase-like protein [Bombardia bombarda]